MIRYYWQVQTAEGEPLSDATTEEEARELYEELIEEGDLDVQLVGPW